MSGKCIESLNNLLGEGETPLVRPLGNKKRPKNNLTSVRI